MKNTYKLMISGFAIAVAFVAIGVILLGFANETFDVMANLFGAPEWELWTPLFPDYEIPGYEGNLLMNVLLGVLFSALILFLTFAIMWLVTRRQTKP